MTSVLEKAFIGFKRAILLDVLNSYPLHHKLIEHRFDLFLFQHANSDWLTHIASDEMAPCDVELCFNGICVKMNVSIADAIQAFSQE